MRVGSLELCGHGQGSNIIQYHFMSLPGQGKGCSFPYGKKENSFLIMGKVWWVEGLPAIVFHCPRLGGHCACKSPFLCTYFVIGIGCCSFFYLMDDFNKWFLTYLCLLSPTEGGAGGGGCSSRFSFQWEYTIPKLQH